MNSNNEKDIVINNDNNDNNDKKQNNDNNDKITCSERKKIRASRRRLSDH